MFDLKVCGVLINIRTFEERVLPSSFQSLSKSSKLYCALDIRILTELRREYGYGELLKGYNSIPRKKLQIYNLDGHLVDEVTYDELRCTACAKIEHSQNFKINHCIFSPDGNKLIFVARWWKDGKKCHSLILRAINDKKSYCILEDVLISHYNWLSNDTIILWGGLHSAGYYIVDIRSADLDNVHSTYISSGPDGHPSLISDGVILTDTYPGKDRHSTLRLLHIRSNNVEEHNLVSLYQPMKFNGEKRVDLHPRSVTENLFYVDSGHTGKRRLYAITKNESSA